MKQLLMAPSAIVFHFFTAKLDPLTSLSCHCKFSKKKRKKNSKTVDASRLYASLPVGYVANTLVMEFSRWLVLDSFSSFQKALMAFCVL